MIRSLLHLSLALLSLCLLLPAHAGNVSFGLSRTDSKLTLTNQGNTTAFYPIVLQLLDDGRWEPLALAAGIAQPAELMGGAVMDLHWPVTLPKTPAQTNKYSLANLHPVMVRFFDQAGASFGQISFFNQPEATADFFEASYINGQLVITPPDANVITRIHASWLLWPQEEGIAPLSAAVVSATAQPAARRIEWHAGMDKVRINLGAGQPAAILLHETAQGFVQQRLSGGGLQGRQQRAGWLNEIALFYNLSLAAAIAALLALMWYLISAWRARSAA
ncbi:hypothetical protein BH11PSE12_BH11PSE12_33320 [soil metagenome]